MTRSYSKIISIALSLLFLSLNDANASWYQPEPIATDLSAIIKDWEKRATLISNWTVAWSGTEYQSPLFVAIAGSSPPPKGVKLDPVTFPFHTRVICEDSRKFCATREGQSWSNESKGLVPWDWNHVFDGEKLSVHYGKDPGKLSFVEKVDYRKYARFDFMLPLTFAFRPLGTSTGGFDPKKIRIVTNGLTIDGIGQIALSHDADLIWIEAGPLHRITKVTLMRADSLRDRTIKFKYGATVGLEGFAPASWQFEKYTDDARSVLFSQTADVTDVKINQKLPPDTFDFVFPVNSWVQDSTTNESYVTKPGGTKRHVGPMEFRGKNIEDIINKELPWTERYGTWAFALGIICLVCIYLAVWSLKKMYRSDRKSA